MKCATTTISDVCACVCVCVEWINVETNYNKRTLIFFVKYEPFPVRYPVSTMLLTWRETDALEVADVPMATFSLVNTSKKECTRTFPVTGNIWCFANLLTLSLSLQSLSVKLFGCARELSMAFENCGKSHGSCYPRMHCNWNSHNMVASICLSSLIGCRNELAHPVVLGVIINVVQWIIGCRRCKDIWAKILTL